jgi:hypothetical protein
MCADSFADWPASPLRSDNSAVPIASPNDEFCNYKLVSKIRFSSPFS